MRARSAAMVVLGLLAAACSGARPKTAEMGTLHAPIATGGADPTVHPARLFPEHVDERTTYGSEPGGGSRVIVGGLRVVTSPKGAVVAADDRLPSPPSSTVALPERLGGGFLFVLGTTLWRADRWLAPAKPIFTSPQPVQAIHPGLDRVYVRGPSMVVALDARSGNVLDMGAWPASPYVASYAAADGWRAAAVTDLRGVVATFDAGATWRKIDVPMDAKQVVLSSESLAIGGIDAQRTEAWYELRADGSLTRLGAPPREAKAKLLPGPPARTFREPAPPPTATAEDKDDLATKPFGKRPLAAAIEDGWPLNDGTAVVAREGALGRVRIEDGALVELVRDAFPLKTARCHPLTLSRPREPGAFGFVCGEARGATVLYAYEPTRGQLVELRRFDKPRTVTSAGNGAIAVRGPCAADGEPAPPPQPDPARLERTDDRAKDGKLEAHDKSADEPKPSPLDPPPRAASPDVHPYCIYGLDDTWREVHVRGDVGSERVVVLADGRIVVVTPPQGVGTAARLTILDRATSANDKPRAVTVPIAFPPVPNDVGRVLRLGLWLDGFEERRPGVLGGWIEAAGVMLGIEVALDGKATMGQFIRDAGMPFVSGRYGLGWTASRRGFETTDGGMTWKSVDLPDPLIPAARVDRRACGPIGCLAYGWLRVGWGEAKGTPVPSVPSPYRSYQSYNVARLELACEPTAPPPPEPPAPRPPPTLPHRISLGTFSTGSGPPPTASVLGSFNGLSVLPPFFSQAAPVLRDSERGINVDVREIVDRYPTMGSLARVYAWGPRTGEWETLGRWQVKWLSPFYGWQEQHAALPSRPPQQITDVVRSASASAYGTYGLSSSSYQFVPGDDASHALLVGRRQVRSDVVLYELEADRAPVEVRKADGDPFGEVEGAVRTAGMWFVSTTTSASGSPVTSVWQIAGGVARELAHIPRTLGDANASARARLARRSDGRAIALVVDGQQTAERPIHVRWALPIDLETGTPGEPEPLGYTDLGDRTLEVCRDDLVGWELDVSAPISSVRVRLPRASGSLSSTFARMRLSSTRACVERLAGSYDGQGPEHLALAAGAARGAPTLRPGEILVSATSMQRRYALRCSAAPKP